MEECSDPSSAGRLTRSQARKRPSVAASGGLKSPLLSDFYQPSRKQARTAAHVSLRQIRKRRGSAGEPAGPQLSGYLGLLPDEVRPLQPEIAGPTNCSTVCMHRTYGLALPSSFLSTGRARHLNRPLHIVGLLGSRTPALHQCSRHANHRQIFDQQGLTNSNALLPLHGCHWALLCQPPAIAFCPPSSSHVQLLQQVLGYCSARELGAMESTCSFFIKSGLTDRVAKHFLREIPRAKGLKPEMRCIGACTAGIIQQPLPGSVPMCLAMAPTESQ